MSIGGDREMYFNKRIEGRDGLPIEPRLGLESYFKNSLSGPDFRPIADAAIRSRYSPRYGRRWMIRR